MTVQRVDYVTPARTFFFREIRPTCARKDRPLPFYTELDKPGFMSCATLLLENHFEIFPSNQIKKRYGGNKVDLLIKNEIHSGILIFEGKFLYLKPNNKYNLF